MFPSTLMASQPNDLSIPCSLLFCLLLLFLNYPTSPSPSPKPDDHQQLPYLSFDHDNRRLKKRRVGLRFHPSSDELIDHYLKNKVLKIDLDELDQWITEIDILNFEPQDLPAFSTVQSDDWYWYFYYRLEDSGRRTRGGGSGAYNRTVKTGNGKWKATGNIRPVKNKKTNKQIGTKKTLVYCPNVVVPHPKPKAKPQAKVHSEWAIHEYQLLPDFPNPDKYVIVMLKKNVDKSVDKAQETINLPEEVNMDLASSSDAPGCQYPLLPTPPVNEISSHSFGMPNAEQVCNHHDPNDQNGHMEEQLSLQSMISSPTDEHTQEDTSSWVNEYNDQYGIDRFCQQMSTPSFVDKYVIVMLKKNGDKSVDKAQEAINLPKEVNMVLASSSDAPGCQYPLLPTPPVNQISSHAFGMPNAEQVCNRHDPNDQNGHMEEELSVQPMISSPTDEHTQEDTSAWVNEYNDQYGIDRFCQQMSTPSFVMNSPPTELGGSIYGYQPIQSIPLDQELQVPHCDTNFNSDLSPFTQAGLDKIFRDIDCETSLQSPKHFEQIPLPSQGWDNARVTTVEP